VVKAVSALTAAFRLVQLDSCGQEVEAACLRQLSPGLHHGILANLHKLSFTSMAGSATHQVPAGQSSVLHPAGRDPPSTTSRRAAG
jgi:hypothetical protein